MDIQNQSKFSVGDKQSISTVQVLTQDEEQKQEKDEDEDEEQKQDKVEDDVEEQIPVAVQDLQVSVAKKDENEDEEMAD